MFLSWDNLIPLAAFLAITLGVWAVLSLLADRPTTAEGRLRRLLNPNAPGFDSSALARRQDALQAKYNAAEEGFRIDNTPQWGRFLRPAGDPLLFRTSNPRCRHAWPEVRPDHRPEPRGPSRDRALAALDHRPRWADPSRPCSSLARSGKDLEGHRRAVRHERPARAQMGQAVPTPWAGWPA